MAEIIQKVYREKAAIINRIVFSKDTVIDCVMNAFFFIIIINGATVLGSDQGLFSHDK